LTLTEEKSEESALLTLKAMRSQTTAFEQEVHEEPSQSRFGFIKTIKMPKI